MRSIKSHSKKTYPMLLFMATMLILIISSQDTLAQSDFFSKLSNILKSNSVSTATLQCDAYKVGCYDFSKYRVDSGSMAPQDFFYYCAASGSKSEISLDPDNASAACSCIGSTDWVDANSRQQCCGDDWNDCARIIDSLRLGQVVDKHLCSMDSKYTGTWHSAEASPGIIKNVYCTAREFVAQEESWIACADATILQIKGSQYLCNNHSRQWAECCSSTTCNSNDPTQKIRGLRTGSKIELEQRTNAGCSSFYPFGQQPFPGCGINQNHTISDSCNTATLGRISSITGQKCAISTFGPFTVPKKDTLNILWDESNTYPKQICTSRGYLEIFNYSFANGPSLLVWVYTNTTGWQQAYSTAYLEKIYCKNNDNDLTWQ